MQTCGNCLRIPRKSKEPRERERGRTDKTGGDQLPAGNPEIGRLEEDRLYEVTSARQPLPRNVSGVWAVHRIISISHTDMH